MTRTAAAFLVTLLTAGIAVGEDTVEIRVEDSVLAVVGPDFYGLHYDGPMMNPWDDVRNREMSLPGMYGSPSAREALHAIGTRVVRIFVWREDTYPQPGAFQWESVDASIEQVVDSGMSPMLCLHQGGATWFIGTQDDPWWQHEEGMAEWRAFARACAERYGDRVRYYEILNEPNHVNKDQPGWIGWDRTVDCFIEAASAIKEADPDALCGGAATWAAWESATWAGHVLDRPEGERLLDFVSYHIYTSHDLEDSNESILSKTPWFEESPRYIQSELAGRTQKRILTALTEFNTSSVFTKDGKPYTDPRDVNAFGGLVSALAYLHSARGGCDMAMHFSTSGGFGLLVWPPRYDRQPVYYALLLLHDIAGLKPGAEMLAVSTPEPPKEVASAVRDTITTHDLEPFAVRFEGTTSVVLINKHRDATFQARIQTGYETPEQTAPFYSYSAGRLPDAVYPISEVAWDQGGALVECPPYSVNVLRLPARTYGAG